MVCLGRSYNVGRSDSDDNNDNYDDGDTCAGDIMDSVDQPLSDLVARLAALIVASETCTECGITFAIKSALQMHSAVMHKKKPGCGCTSTRRTAQFAASRFIAE